MNVIEVKDMSEDVMYAYRAWGGEYSDTYIKVNGRLYVRTNSRNYREIVHLKKTVVYYTNTEPITNLYKSLYLPLD